MTSNFLIVTYVCVCVCVRDCMHMHMYIFINKLAKIILERRKKITGEENKTFSTICAERKEIRTHTHNLGMGLCKKTKKKPTKICLFN